MQILSPDIELSKVILTMTGLKGRHTDLGRNDDAAIAVTNMMMMMMMVTTT